MYPATVTIKFHCENPQHLEYLKDLFQKHFYNSEGRARAYEIIIPEKIGGKHA